MDANERVLSMASMCERAVIQKILNSSSDSIPIAGSHSLSSAITSQRLHLFSRVDRTCHLIPQICV